MAAPAASAHPFWALAFTHTCTNLGCREPGCALCAHNPRRACVSALAPKCLAGDGMRAACGAPPRVEAVWVGGEGGGTAAGAGSAPPPPQPPLPAGAAVEVLVLDGKQYAVLLDAGRGGDAAAAASCVLRANNGGGPLLVRNAPRGGGAAAADAAPSPGGGVLLDLSPGSACTFSVSLADLAVTGSSESLLSGQRPPFRLLARAVDAASGAPLPDWAVAVSDPFVAATPRVRTAIKADIPCVDDHVSKLNSVGPQTQAKLAAIGAEAAAAGLALALPHACVTNVGQFRDVAALAAADPALADALKRVLKLTKGWEAACDHAFAAVEPDAQARVWYEGGPTSGGLVWRAAGGAPDLAAPLGLLWRDASRGGAAFLTPLDRVPSPKRPDLARLAAAAVACWAAPGHPGWAVWAGVDSRALETAATAAGEVAVGAAAPAGPAASTLAAAHRSAAADALGGPALSALPRPSLLATGGASWGGGGGGGGAAAAAAAAPAPGAAPQPRAFVPASPFAVADGLHAPPPSGAAAAAAVAMAAHGSGAGTATTAGPAAPKRTRLGGGPIDAAALRTHLSAVAGRALSGLDMARLVPSYPAVTPSDELFAATGLAPLEFSGSELARLGGGGATAAATAARAASGGDEALLRFLNERLGLAPGSGLARPATAGGRPAVRPAPASRGLTGIPSLGGASLSDLPTLPSALFVGLGSMPPPPQQQQAPAAGVAPVHETAEEEAEEEAAPAPSPAKKKKKREGGQQGTPGPAPPVSTRRSARRAS